MTPREVMKNLRLVQKRHKDDFIRTGEIRVSDMAKDAADAIESLLTFTDSIHDLPNCNTCTFKHCNYRPKLGQSIRYNCPLC